MVSDCHCCFQMVPSINDTFSEEMLSKICSNTTGMTEVTTDRNDQPVAVGGNSNYAVSCANISE